MRKLLAATAIATTGCASMLSTTADAQAFASSAFIGNAAEAFFQLHGLPVASMQTSDGGMIYEWQSGVSTYAMPTNTTATSTRVGNQIYTQASTTGGGVLTTYCRARLTVGRDGKITDFRITGDTIGAWGLSRCAEVLR